MEFDRKQTLQEIGDQLRELYSQMVKRSMDRREADSRANVLGKRLKAVQLDIADDLYLSYSRTKLLK